MSEGLSRAGFDLALKDGEKSERALWSILHVKIGDRVEVKSDGIASRSEQLFVEYKQRGRLSGLSTTTADWWAFEVGDTWIIVPTSRLKAAARLAIDRDLVKKGGDFNRYDGAMVPIRWLVSPWTSA